jgi:hypothetical protein
LSEKGNSFLRLLKNKGFREESMTKVGLYAIGTSTTLESNKSLGGKFAFYRHLSRKKVRLNGCWTDEEKVWCPSQH